MEKMNIRPEVLTVDDVVKLVPKLEGHRKLVGKAMHWLQFDEVNAVHARWCDTPGPEFVRRMVEDDFRIKLDIKGKEILENLPEGPFITVSNHPFGAIDGILLIYMITRYRPKFKVMVNMVLGYIQAMRPNFIAVDALATDDPEKRKVSMLGIREALRQIKDGEPLGFFPAGAMSKTDIHGKLQDREWQKTVVELIARAKVPVIPIFFQGSNSRLFNIMGHICWPLRSLMLPREVFRKKGTTVRVSVGTPISPEEIKEHSSSEKRLASWLREQTFRLRD